MNNKLNHLIKKQCNNIADVMENMKILSQKKPIVVIEDMYFSELTNSFVDKKYVIPLSTIKAIDRVFRGNKYFLAVFGFVINQKDYDDCSDGFKKELSEYKYSYKDEIHYFVPLAETSDAENFIQLFLRGIDEWEMGREPKILKTNNTGEK